MTSGTAGSETDGYDKNGSETSTTISGVTYRETYDDEDRMTSIVVPNVGTDTFVYNGLGLRVGKTDSTGTYTYLCDGASPGSDVLYDGHAVYTAGLSETRNGTSAYYSNDLLGNLWTLDGSSKNQLTYEDFTGFGSVTAGSNGQTPFGFGGGNGCLSEADTGLVLMGHRYYDTRIGRFITQDRAKSGGNWYRYAGNNPTNKIDPSGLSDGLPGTLGSPDQRYGGPFGFDPGGLFGGQGSTGSFQTQTGQQTQGPAVPNTNFIFISQGMMHPAPIIIDDYGLTDDLSGLLALADRYIPKKYRTAAHIAANALLAKASYSGAMAGYKVYAAYAETADALSIISPGVFGASGYAGFQAAGALAGTGLAAGVAIGATIYAGYETGSWIANQPWGPHRATVTDSFSNDVSNWGIWLQKNTTFGH